METTEEINRPEGVEVATLEAISENTPAIELYKKMSYEIVDSLLLMNHDGDLKIEETCQPFSFEKASAHRMVQYQRR